MKYRVTTKRKIVVKHELRNEQKSLPGNLPSLLLCMTSLLLLYVETCVQVIRPERAITGIGWYLTGQQRGDMTPLPLAVKDGKRCVTSSYTADTGVSTGACSDRLAMTQSPFFEGKILCYLHVSKIYCCLVHLRRKLTWTLLISSTRLSVYKSSVFVGYEKTN